MDVRLPVKHRRPGVCYAVTDDGVELPVVDITSTEFPVGVAAEELDAFAADSLRFMDRWAKVPGGMRRLLARRSHLMREAAASGTGFMTGMATYLNKLGPDNLGDWATGTDRRAAAMLPAVAVRVRLRQVARLVADAIAALPAAESAADRTVHLVNLGGGTAVDSLNALLLLAAERPDALAGCSFAVEVLDLGREGPDFGARALAALQAPGAPLAGVDASLRFHGYDWSRAGDLPEVLTDAGVPADGTPAVVSSEGGLFEYAGDDDVVANLRALGEACPSGTVVVGSAFRETAVVTTMRRMSGMTFVSRSPERLDELGSPGGWHVDRLLEGNPVYHVFTLARAHVSPAARRVH